MPSWCALKQVQKQKKQRKKDGTNKRKKSKKRKRKTEEKYSLSAIRLRRAERWEYTIATVSFKVGENAAKGNLVTRVNDRSAYHT